MSSGHCLTPSVHAEHLWDIPAHRQAWERVAAQEGGFGQLYHSFCHFLETDAIYLLNDAVQTLPTGVLCSNPFLPVSDR